LEEVTGVLLIVNVQADAQR